MLKLNRTTEYGLMAISYIRGKAQGEITSAREISDSFDIPFEILAKTLQKLKETGVITSTYGTRGGYVLNRDLTTLKLSEFLTLMEGPIAVVACAHRMPETIKSDTVDQSGCEYMGSCNIHPMMSALNSKFYDFLSRISVDELTHSSAKMAASSDVPLARTTQQTAVAFQGEEP